MSEIKVAELVRDIMGGSSAYHHSINAAAELITEITDQSLEDQFSSNMHMGNGGPWVDDDGLWRRVGDLSTEFL